VSRLNLGCGANLFEGWINVDIDDVEETYIRHLCMAEHVDGWPEWQQKQWSYIRSGGTFDFTQCDFMANQPPAAIRIGARLFENSLDAIYIGQAVEHLNPIHELPQLLTRCYGALKPGGVLRMTTPDLNVIVNHLNDGNMDRFSGEQPAYYAAALEADKFSYLLFGATGPNCTRKNYEGHFHIFTVDTLMQRCADAGFNRDLASTDWPSKRLPDVRDFGKSHSFALEVVKP
jgi:SAM-dependent methyltransferase